LRKRAYGRKGETVKNCGYRAGSLRRVFTLGASIGTALVLTAALAVSVASAGTAGAGACSVKNMSLKGKAAQFGGDLATALGTAATGDTLEIGGTCVGNFSAFRSVTLVGKSSGKSQATLDGGQTGTVLYVAPNANVTVSGLLITNGNSSAGGGIYASVASNLTLSNSVVSGNTSTGSGGGIVTTGALSLIGSYVQGNTAAYYGGGIYNGGSVSIDAPSVVSGNQALDGGGVYSAGGSVSGSLLGISGNTPNNCGGSFTGC
jgi:predicted outer membrane repeat protein